MYSAAIFRLATALEAVMATTTTTVQSSYPSPCERNYEPNAINFFFIKKKEEHRRAKRISPDFVCKIIYISQWAVNGCEEKLRTIDFNRSLIGA